MNIDELKFRKLVQDTAAVVIDSAVHLTDLDQAIGDGDHGVNMKRGFEAVVEGLDTYAAKPLPEGLKAVGMQLVMKVGGASGPLYGTLFMSLGKALPDGEFTLVELADALGQAIDAVKARGKSETGQKTMLDVLVPVYDALRGGGEDLLGRLPRVADDAAEATVPMLATKGRASFLGERSIGHMDPGACSTALMTAAVCRSLGEQ